MPWLTFSIAAMLKLTYVQLKICSRHRSHFFPIEGHITIMEKVKEDSGKKVKEDSRSEQRK